MNNLMKREQQGFTLVELMVSVTISMIVLAGVFQLYLTASQTQRSQEGVARIQENMRYLFGKLEEDITQTGHLGCIPFLAGGGDTKLITNRLTKKMAGLYDFDNFLSGTEGAGLNGSDTMVVRYFSAASAIPLQAKIAGQTGDITLDKNDARYKLLKQYDIGLISDCSFGDVFMITNDPLTSNGIIAHDSVTADPDGQSNDAGEFTKEYGDTESDKGSTAYFFGGGTAVLEWKLGTSAAGAAAGAVCSVATPQYCALLRDDEELAEGVENLQIQYGWLNAGSNLLVTDATGVGDWNTVDRIIVTLTLNSVQYAPTNDGQRFTTKEISKTFMLRNQLPGGI